MKNKIGGVAVAAALAGAVAWNMSRASLPAQGMVAGRKMEGRIELSPEDRKYTFGRAANVGANWVYVKGGPSLDKSLNLWVHDLAKWPDYHLLIYDGQGGEPMVVGGERHVSLESPTGWPGLSFRALPKSKLAQGEEPHQIRRDDPRLIATSFKMPASGEALQRLIVEGVGQNGLKLRATGNRIERVR